MKRDHPSDLYTIAANALHEDAQIYRVRSSQCFASVLLLVVGTSFIIAIWGGVLTGSRDPKVLEMVFPVVFTFMAGIFTLRAFRNYVRFSDQAIELRRLSGVQILPLEKVKGRRRYLSKGDEGSPDVWHLVLEPNDDRYPKLDIDDMYKFDERFYTWFNALPDLDEQDKHRYKTSNFGLV